MKPTLAIVGVGYWGRKLLDRFLNMDCHVKWLCDPALDPNYSKAAGILYPAKSLAEALEQDCQNIDAVVIATPASTHFDLVRQAIMAGKHVLCEKPLVPTAAAARELFGLLKPGQVLMTGHTYLFHPTVRMFGQSLQAVGDIRQLSSVREAPTTPRADCSVILDLLAHDVSIFNWFMGSVPNRVQAIGTNVTARVVLWYGDAPAFVSLSWNAPAKVRTISVTGSLKSFNMDEMACPPHPEPLAAECQHFLDCVNGVTTVGQSGDCCISGPDMTLNVVRVVEAAEESLNAGGKVVMVGGGV